MDDVKEWAWLIQTDKGNFYITVVGKWTQAEASVRLRALFHTVLQLNIIGMISRKRNTGKGDNSGTLYEVPDPEPGADFNFIAGKKIWEACGRGVEYEANMILMEKEGG